MNVVSITSGAYLGRRKEAINHKIEARVSFFLFHQFLCFFVLVTVLDPKDITAHDFCLECTISYVDFSIYHLAEIFVYVREYVLINTDRLLIARHLSVRTRLKLLDSSRHPMILLHSNFSFEFAHNPTQHSFSSSS